MLRLFVNGKEAAKNNAKEWRPLKQLAVGDRLGFLYEKDKMKISVFINGDKETGPLPIWPTHVASSRLIQKGGCYPKTCKNCVQTCIFEML